MDISIWFYLMLFAVAMLYSSVGHGGASGYIAVMSLFSFTPETIRPMALMLNIGVSFFAFQRYYQSGNFKWKLFWPFILTSVPFAWLGGKMVLSTHLFHTLLGVLLIFPVLNLLRLFPERKTSSELQLVPAFLIGAVIGWLSGMIGIGGGILLSPVLLLLGWATMKESAAVAALFIFINSLVVLLALDHPSAVLTNDLLPVFPVVFAGGLLGAQLGAFTGKVQLLKSVLALVLLIASVKLIFV